MEMRKVYTKAKEVKGVGYIYTKAKKLGSDVGPWRNMDSLLPCLLFCEKCALCSYKVPSIWCALCTQTVPSVQCALGYSSPCVRIMPSAWAAPATITPKKRPAKSTAVTESTLHRFRQRNDLSRAHPGLRKGLGGPCDRLRLWWASQRWSRLRFW